MKWISLFILLCTITLIQGQTPLDSINHGSYLFKLSSNKIDSIYKYDISIISNSFLRKNIDFKNYAYEYNDEYKATLPVGDFLIANVSVKTVSYELFSINNCYVGVSNNGGDLLLSVQDSSLNVLSDLQIFLKYRRLSFDKKTQMYRLPSPHIKGLLKVHHLGRTNYFFIEQQDQRSWWKRRYHWIMQTPFKWLILPFYYAINLPIDGVKSIRNGYNVGSVYRINRLIRRTSMNLRNRFNPLYGSEDFPSYFVLNKPKFKPLDSLKYKAYILDHRKSPMTRELDFVLHGKMKNGRYETKKIHTVSPSSAGAYDHQFVLHDSLNLLVGQNYQVRLGDRNNTYASTSFKFENYTLSTINFTADIPITHTRIDTLSFICISKDENQLPILDGYIDVKLETKHMKSLDTGIWISSLVTFHEKISPDPSGTTEIKIAPDKLPPGNSSCVLTLNFVRADLESDEISGAINFVDSLLKISMSLSGTKLITSIDNKNGVVYDGTLWEFTKDKISKIPHTSSDSFEINREAYRYEYYVEKQSKRLNISKKDLRIIVNQSINADSCIFKANSVWDIPFSYFIYEGNREINRGYGTELHHRIRKPSRHIYTLVIQTLWAGEIQQFNYIAQLNKHELLLDVQYPKEVFPGESVNIEIQALDYKNNPVENLNLTVHSFKSMLNYASPIMPMKHIKRKSRRIKNHFDFSTHKLTHTDNTNYRGNIWSDTIQKSELYKFSFPKRSMYQLSLPVKDSVTQIAPFLISKGDIIPIHALFIDEYPVFFNWTDQSKKYSFSVSEGYHSLKFRIEDKLITVDSVYVHFGVKNIVSLDINYYKNITIEPRTRSFNQSDFEMIAAYQFSYKPSYRDFYTPSWFTNRDSSEIFILQDYSNILRNRTTPLTIGPVLDHKLMYRSLSGLSQESPILPGYEHEVEAELVTRTAKYNKFKTIPEYFFNKPFQYSFSDQVTTKENLNNLTNQFEYDYRRRNDLQRQILNKSGSIRLLIPENAQDYLNVIVESLEPTTSTQILAGNTKQINNLREGYYRLICIHNNKPALVYDSVEVRNRKTTFIDLDRTRKSLTTSQVEEIEKLVHQLYLSRIKNEILTKDSKYLVGEKLMSMRGLLPTSMVQYGQLIESGGSVIGATISVYDFEGNRLKSTISDFDGKFSIQDDKLAYLEIYSLGLERCYIPANHQGEPLEIFMEIGRELLDEVVVVNYSTNSELKSVGFSVTAAGITADEMNQVSIRGSRTQATTYYVDGIQITEVGKIPQSENIASIQEIVGSEAQKVYNADKVVLYTTKKALYPVKKGSSLRKNFSDEGFWIPNLLTDANGKAHCTVVFPDDISSWDIQLIGMNAKEQTALHRGKIRSYKNLSTSLITPGYLIADDQVQVKSILKHYIDKEITVRHAFLINDEIKLENDITFDQVHEDNFMVDTEADSLQVTYRMNYEDYIDGEKRKIKILPQGLEKSKGLFTVLSPGEKLEMKTDTFGSSFRFYAQMSELQIMEMELAHLRNYKYLCNEQLASKLIAYIITDRINNFHRSEPKHKKDINRIIRLLEKRYRQNSFWAWWESGPTNTWVSQHVIDALEIAKKASYKVNIDYQASLNELASSFFATDETTTKLDILEMIQSIDSTINLSKYFESIDTIFTHSGYDYLRWTSQRQAQGFDIEIDSILTHLKETSLGSIYFNSNDRNADLYDVNIRKNELMQTLLAYRVLRHEEFKNKSHTMRMLRVHILSSRINGHWRNTYESIEIIQTLMDRFSLDNSLLENFASLEANGNTKKIRATIDSTLVNPGSLSIENHSTNFMYLTIYENYWESSPSIHNGLGLIQQSLGDESQTELTMEHEEKSSLQISFSLDHQSEYIMLETPIPAGLKAIEVEQQNGESYRSYEEDRILIFFEKLQPGVHRIDLAIQATFSGKFTWNPSKLSLMYFPILHSNTGMNTVLVK